MDIPQEVIDEIRKHDLSILKKLDESHYGVFWSIKFLEDQGASNLAEFLKQVVRNGGVRIGAFEGFVAAAVTLDKQNFIFLSDKYAEYNTPDELSISLVHEIGAFAVFSFSPHDNELRGLHMKEWLLKRNQQPVTASIFTKAVQKTESKISKALLTDVLLEMRLITQDQLNDARDKQLGAKRPLHDLIVEMGFISDEQLAQVFSKTFDMPVEHIKDEDIDPEVLLLLKFDYLRRYGVYPIKMENNKLILAMSNPRDVSALDDLGMLIDVPIKPILVSRREIYNRLEGSGASDEAVDSLLNNVEQVAAPTRVTVPVAVDAKDLVVDMEKKEKAIPQLHHMPAEYQVLLQEESPTVKLVNLVLTDALKARSSDVHIEPREQFIDVRYRIDGDLKNILQVPIKLHSKIVARVKILANLDITQNMAPQDGRIQLDFDGNKVDFRVSTVPTFYGEKIVIRILDGKAAKVDLNVLGFNDHEKALFVEAVKNPQGMVLVTGPTGSGKTSTLYAALNFVKNETNNIVTIEDPIEFLNEGINQIQVNPARGVTFASGLRSILRQDPNVILLGEIRDKETADIALKASITGHLLLSTLHTNSCVATITRLADVGIDYYQIASALVLVVSQRLVKTICPDCKQEYKPTDEFKVRFDNEIKQFNLSKFYHGKGCAKCSFSGYRGRIAVFEVLKITEGVKNVIAKGSTEEEIYKEAQKQGFKRLIDSGIDKVISGITTLDEVVKHLGNIEKTAHEEVKEVVVNPVIDPNRKKKVLLVDDEDDIRKIVGKYLQMGGYEVIQAVNGQDGIEKAFKQKPDLIITDLMMPVMDGLEEVKILRSTMETAVIPIIMLTAKQDKESELAGINAGADDYITKPFDKEKLLARVGMLLKRESLRHA